MSNHISDEEFFTALSERTREAPEYPLAPSDLKARIYSAIIRRQQALGPLLSLSETREAGRPLCVFETLLERAAEGRAIESLNPCRVCHARLLAERFERAPIYWRHCPYVTFQNR